jgi:hypothetical protein
MPLPSGSLLPTASLLPGIPTGDARPPVPILEVT